jgi:hypothetical protein
LTFEEWSCEGEDGEREEDGEGGCGQHGICVGLLMWSNALWIMDKCGFDGEECCVEAAGVMEG